MRVRVHVCVCVCVRERERERVNADNRHIITDLLLHCAGGRSVCVCMCACE